MRNETRKKIETIVQRYARHGITMEQLEKLIESRPDEITEEMAVDGIRLALGHEYGEREYFDIHAVAGMLGTSEDEALSMAQDAGCKIITGVTFGTQPPEEWRTES